MTAEPAQETCAHFTDEITAVVPYRWDPTSRVHVPATATKTFQFEVPSGRWTKVSDYDEHSAVRLFPTTCTSLAELAGLVELVGTNDGYIVRGGLTEAAEAAMGGDGFCNRRKTAKKPGDQPSLRETPHHWLMIDVDDWPIPAHLSLADAADHVLIIDTMIGELCTEPFHDADCWFNWSSSAGLLFNDTAKAHLWFWLDRAEANDHLRRYLMATMPGVDHAPFNAVQPHYVAPPVLVGGHDPLPTRTGWRLGLHETVTLPEFTPQQVVAVRQASSYGHSTGTWADPLCHVGDDKRRFYTPIRDAIWGYAGIIERGATHIDAKVIGIIQQVVATAVRSPTRDIGRYLDAGWLQRMIDEAVNKRQALGGSVAA
jgi:hypothetical protein